MGPARWPFPRVIAHRGGGRFAPENTLAALRKGHELGYRAVEFDVMLSADNQPLLIHDETLERTTDGHGLVAESQLESLQRLDAGAWFGAAWRGERLPGFRSAALLCRELGLWANVEIKPARAQERATGRVAAGVAQEAWAGAALPPLLSSFHAECLVEARAVAPELPRALLFDAVPADWQAQLQDLGCIALHCNAAKLKQAEAQAIAGAGYGLAVWTVNDADTAVRLFAWGVDALFTDRLDLIPPDFTGRA